MGRSEVITLKAKLMSLCKIISVTPRSKEAVIISCVPLWQVVFSYCLANENSLSLSYTGLLPSGYVILTNGMSLLCGLKSFVASCLSESWEHLLILFAPQKPLNKLKRCISCISTKCWGLYAKYTQPFYIIPQLHWEEIFLFPLTWKPHNCPLSFLLHTQFRKIKTYCAKSWDHCDLCSHLNSSCMRLLELNSIFKHSLEKTNTGA